MADEPIKLTIQDTPDKLRPLAEEAAAFLAGVLRELAEAENRSFAQYTRPAGPVLYGEAHCPAAGVPSQHALSLLLQLHKDRL